MWRWLLLVDPRVFWAPGCAVGGPRAVRAASFDRRFGSLSGPAADGHCGPRAPQLGLPISPVPQPGPCGPSGALHAGGGGGFAALEAGCRRVAGVSWFS